MKVRAIDFIVTVVSDADRAKAFYEGVLGLKSTGFGDENWIEFDTHPVSFGLDAAPLITESPSKTAVALAVDDVAAAVEELRQKGVTILAEPFESPVCFVAVIADPDGNPIYLHKRKDGTVG